ncbi:MAG: hypothetical protein RQ824_12330 [bacterium]|nr:hypothetical protein [bacterium]
MIFLIGYGRVFELEWGSLGKHPENFLPLPVVLTLYLAFKERRYRLSVTYREKVFVFYALFISLMPLWGLHLDKSLDAIREFWAAAAFAMLIMYNVREEKEVKLFISVFMSAVALRAWNFNSISISEPKYNAIVRGVKYAHLHNDLLQSLVSLGLIGVSMYLFFVFQTFYMSWKIFRRGVSPFSRAMGAAGFIWIIAHVLAGMVHHEYTNVRYNMSVAFIVSILLITYYSSCLPLRASDDRLETSPAV